MEETTEQHAKLKSFPKTGEVIQSSCNAHKLPAPQSTMTLPVPFASNQACQQQQKLELLQSPWAPEECLPHEASYGINYLDAPFKNKYLADHMRNSIRKGQEFDTQIECKSELQRQWGMHSFFLKKNDVLKILFLLFTISFLALVLPRCV